MARVALLFVQGFLAVSALICGALFLLAPDGRLIGMPLDVLRYGPFTDFFWPGVILFCALGIGHAAGFALTLQRSSRYRSVGMLLGLVTLGWIGGQLLMVRPFSFLQAVIGGLGMLELLFAFSSTSRAASR
ncbi:MAG TPA: hypothetical protein PK760_00030 [Flavobacteriales bacterium]|nr:hypothetical protein [Flavobacteriales bacterium]